MEENEKERQSVRENETETKRGIRSTERHGE